MRQKIKKPGTKVTIMCPECDGEGKAIIGQEGIPIICTMCNGTGKVDATVTAQ